MMYGTRSKLNSGGGEVAYHSSVSATHGSLVARSPLLEVLITLTTKMSIPTAIVNAPIDEIMLYASQSPP